MFDHEVWRTDAAGVLVAESRTFRLIVEVPRELSGAVRFLVLRRGEAGIPDSLLGSGTRDDVRTAMTAAERMAERSAALMPVEIVLSP